jgi:LysR family hydrogen peroxide-inducible transcriptional activator
MAVELWEDLTDSLLDLLRGQGLDCALIATETRDRALTSIPLFVEPFLAAVPPGHRLASSETVDEADFAADVLVLSEGHCLAAQALNACGRQELPRQSFRAASLETLVNLVAAGHGTTLIPGLAAVALGGRNVVLRPLAGGTSRTIRLVSRTTFPRPQALRALEKVVRQVMSSYQ